MPERILIIKVFNILTMLGLFIADAIALDLDYKLMIVALAGSISGAFVLGYFERKDLFWERMVKMLSSGIAGLFVGAFFSRYLGLVYLEYIAMMYFICSFTALVFLKAVLSFTQNNAKELVVRIFTNVFLPKGDLTPVATSQEKHRSKQRATTKNGAALIHSSDVSEKILVTKEIEVIEVDKKDLEK